MDLSSQEFQYKDKYRLRGDLEVIWAMDSVVTTKRFGFNKEESAAGGDMLPSLMLADKSDDQLSRELFQLSNKCIREIRLPQAYGKICMSSCGWLLTLGEDFATQLVNPLSQETINLPKLDKTLQDQFFSEFPDDHVNQFESPVEWNKNILKALLVIPSNLVFVIWYRRRPAFCHFGDKRWTTHVEEPPVLVDVATLPADYDLLAVSAYIIGLDDDERKRLLLIVREGLNDEDTTGVIKGNCIYYTDDVFGQYHRSEKGGGRDMGIYHMSDGTIEPHFAGESLSHLTPPIWLEREKIATFAKLCEKKNLDDSIMNMGAGGAVSVAAPAADGAAASPAAEEKKEEAKEESDDIWVRRKKQRKE
ncbi:hypothetical protein Tco_0893407 [Tanacetum coccineum]|uniref:KIB1-4 beta-propeller domain-containing protein n=1 Tax=Tanacetum coccineum TaxID=301880 RepID=A0ABQ5C8R5_9ASTR